LARQSAILRAGVILRSKWAGIILVACILAAIATASTIATQTTPGITADPTLPKPFRVYRSLEAYDDIDVPPDYQEQTEFIFARLMYPSHPYGLFSRSRGYAEIADRDWRQGGMSWTQDYPRADRHFLLALSRLTRIDVRPVEQPVNLDDEDDVYNWPMLYAVRPGEWDLTDKQAAKMRDYLARGGFFWCDDFWGPFEWDVFMQSMGRVLPGKTPVDIPEEDTAFHIVYDLKNRIQILGAWGLYGRGAQNGGDTPYWRAIYDDRGRIEAAITPNSDLGDAWEYADDPGYPEEYSHLAINIGVNYVMYALTH
jgi:hypothetical protein